MGEEPRGDSSHVGLGVARHLVQAVQVGVVGLDGTNKVAENRGIEAGSETAAEGLEHVGGRLGGQLDGPSRVPVVNAVDDSVKILEGIRVGEEGRKEVNLVVPGELVDELGLPTIGGRIGTKGAGVSGKGRNKDFPVVLQLVRVVGVLNDIVYESGGILRRRAWKHTATSQSS